jgi:hypothetical protein
MAEQPVFPLNSASATTHRGWRHRWTAPSLRWRIAVWTVGAFASALGLLTVVSVVDEYRQIAALERAQAEALLAHLASMPEFRSDLEAAAHHLAMLRDTLRAAGAHVELTRPGLRLDEASPLAVRTLRFENATLELRYLDDPDRLRNVMRRSIVMHATYGLATLAALVVGILWILKRHLILPLDRITHQLTRMRSGGGWIAAVPQSDAELFRLVDAVRALGPGLAHQVEEWVKTERTASSALTLGRIRRRLNEPLRLLRLQATNLQTGQTLSPEATRRLRALLIAVDGLDSAIQEEEELHFGDRCNGDAL